MAKSAAEFHKYGYSCPVSHDPWMNALERSARGASRPLEGRVLRVKLGYNPNSSSVGSVVTVLFWSAAASAAALNLVSALLAKRRAANDDS